MVLDAALGRGLVDKAGARHRRVRLRPLTGGVELELAARGAPAGRLDPEQVDELLAACVERIGEFREITPAHVAALSRGDRNRLALLARAVLVGDPVLVVVRCPAEACAALADVSLSTADLVADGVAPQPLALEVDTPDGQLTVRPPTGLDELWAAGSDAALWGRLVSRAGHPLGAAAWGELDPVSTQLVAITLAGLDPCADLAFVSGCPRCATWIELELDPVELLVRGLATGEQRLLAEVHSLAFHYGWSEADILALARPRRLAYLELLCNQVEGRPLLAAGA